MHPEGTGALQTAGSGPSSSGPCSSARAPAAPRRLLALVPVSPELHALHHNSQGCTQRWSRAGRGMAACHRPWQAPASAQHSLHLHLPARAGQAAPLLESKRRCAAVLTELQGAGHDKDPELQPDVVKAEAQEACERAVATAAAKRGSGRSWCGVAAQRCEAARAAESMGVTTGRHPRPRPLTKVV